MGHDSQSLGSISPISRLSPELLAEIFLIITNDERYDFSRADTTRAASQVCCHWRSIALGYGKLWGSHIHYERSSLRWVQELLDRAASSCFDITIFGRFRINSNVKVLLALEHGSRWRIVNVAVLPSELKSIRRELQYSTPFLEELRLETRDTKPGACTPSILPTSLCGNNAPRLRCLELRNCHMDLCSPVLRNLLELTVKDISFQVAPSVQNWLCILAGMPFLESLTIAKAISSDSTGYSILDVHLDNLSDLALQGTMDSCKMLLEHLIMPLEYEIELNCTQVRPGAAFGKFCEIISSKLAIWPRSTTERVLSAHLNTGSLMLSTWSERYSDSSEYSDSIDSRYLNLELDWDIYEEGIPSILSPLSPSFSSAFSVVSCVDLSITPGAIKNAAGRSALLDLLHPLKDVKTLFLDGITHKILFPLIQENSTMSSGTDQPSLVLFSSLRRIAFQDVNFTGDRSFVKVISFLRWRADVGFPVKSVAIEGSRMQKKKKQMFIDMGVELAWGDYNDNVDSSDSSE